jgi:hypothetical protein
MPNLLDAELSCLLLPVSFILFIHTYTYSLSLSLSLSLYIYIHVCVCVCKSCVDTRIKDKIVFTCVGSEDLAEFNKRERLSEEI